MKLKESDKGKPGDFVNVPAHERHRVEWTTPDEPTISLAVHHEDDEDEAGRQPPWAAHGQGTWTIFAHVGAGQKTHDVAAQVAGFGNLENVFCGSGTMLAAGLDFGASRVIGIEQEKKYLAVAKKRIAEG